MVQDLKDALRIPRGLLLGIIIVLLIFGLSVLFRLGNHQDAGIPILFFALLPYVIPYFLSFNYPIIAGGILIFEGTIFTLLFIMIQFYSVYSNDKEFNLTLGFFLLLLTIFLGIWMIVITRKFRKYSKKSSQSKSVEEVEGLE